MPSFFDVIWLWDFTAKKSKTRMMICIDPENGMFLRINSNDTIRPCVPVHWIPNHDFLDHDSFIEISVLEFDEYQIEESVRDNGIAGTLDDSMREPLLIGILAQPTLSSKDKDRIRVIFSR